MDPDEVQCRRPRGGGDSSAARQRPAWRLDPEDHLGRDRQVGWNEYPGAGQSRPGIAAPRPCGQAAHGPRAGVTSIAPRRPADKAGAASYGRPAMQELARHHSAALAVDPITLEVI